jgi:hypothetical protein
MTDELLPKGQIIGEPGIHAVSLMDPDWAGWSRENPFQCSALELGMVASVMDGMTKKKAALDAGYEGNYPTRYGREVLMRERVQQEMKRQANTQARDITYDPAKVLHCLVMIAEADIVDALIHSQTTAKLKLTNLANLPQAVKYAIKSIKFSPSGQVKIELHDKLRALRMIGEFFNMWGAESGRGGGGDGAGAAEVIDETIVYERRMDKIGEVIRGRIDRTIRKFERGDDARTVEQPIDPDSGGTA